MKQFFKIALILIALPIIGATGFVVVEDFRWLDAFYLTFITLSTIGYETVRPLSDSGKIFVIFYIIFGFALFLFSLSKFGELLVNGEIQRLLEGGFMNKRLGKMKDHVIICGFGRMGAAVAHELQQAKMKFVIIEWDAKRQELIREKGWDFVEGDATQDEILLRCHIQEARAIACVLPNDAENLLAVMSAKLLNNRCFIVTRANSDDVIPKLERAGANRIVSPYSAGAVRMANLIQTPALQDFYEIAKLKENKIDMDYVKVSEKSPFLGKKLEDCLRGRKGLSVVGAKNQKGELYIPVPPGLEIKAGDSYFVVGEAELMKDFVTNLV